MLPIPNQYSLNWDSYETNICKGFSTLQQNGEFVDMTLAADGHLVKVHQILIALASPYLNELIRSVPAQHPVIFLNNVPHATLSLLLEYIYTGEVLVPAIHLQSFMEAARSLRIRGLESFKSRSKNCYSNVSVPQTTTMLVHSEVDTETPINIEPASVYLKENEVFDINGTEEPNQHAVSCNVSEDDEKILDMKTTEEEVLPQTKQLNTISDEYTIGPIESNMCAMDVEHCVVSNIIRVQNNELQPETENKAENSKSGLYKIDGYEYKLEVHNDNILDPSLVKFNVADAKNTLNSIKTHNSATSTSSEHLPSSKALDLKDISPQYSMSTRGSLQLILNRYMYYCHHKSNGGRKRRWRCIDYRKSQCRAYIDTDDEIITIRKFHHTHSFHDKQIKKKVRNNMIFTSIKNISTEASQ